jgi:hypothetical protein
LSNAPSNLWPRSRTTSRLLDQGIDEPNDLCRPYRAGVLESVVGARQREE